MYLMTHIYFTCSLAMFCNYVTSYRAVRMSAEPAVSFFGFEKGSINFLQTATPTYHTKTWFKTSQHTLNFHLLEDHKLTQTILHYTLYSLEI